MLEAAAFLDAARARGFDFYTGVPCSFLTPVINRAISDPALAYVGAASEGEAVAIAAGAWLAGRRTVVMCQNSGLGNTVNPLTSLNTPFRIPTLMVVTWRGQPGLKDEPQHALMGQITQSLLDVMRVAQRPFPTTADEIDTSLAAAEATMAETELPFAFVMEHGTVRADGLDQPRPAGGRAAGSPTRRPAVRRRAASRSWNVCWRRSATMPPSSRRRASAGASCSPSPTGRSTSTRSAPWAVPAAWAWASPATSAGPSSCSTATARR